ncbi:hypothetical protein HBN50_12900 [Halobacteriovorax sp. GB3]|nr:hypothetical protein [Halobacteriovorax sp. GB3]MDD0854003.1 hypothetical protein [Halobacteriovorax sp. GB3]
MKKIIILGAFITIILSITSCGQDGAAISPGGSGSTIQQVNANCNDEPCI